MLYKTFRVQKARGIIAGRGVSGGQCTGQIYSRYVQVGIRMDKRFFNMYRGRAHAAGDVSSSRGGVKGSGGSEGMTLHFTVQGTPMLIQWASIITGR